MNLAPQFRAGGPASSPLWLACLVALTGCGGATYGIGTIPGDGGRDADGGAANGCTSHGGCDDGGSTIGAGDEGGSGFVFSDAGTTTAACTPAPINCTGGATGYACSPAVNPTEAQPTLSCTSGVIGAYGVEFCCFPWPGGSACTPDETFPCSGSYPYQCTPGKTPTDVDSKLSCGSSFPGSNGEDEYCCTYP